MYVSVITINYNNAHGLQETIESVLSQTMFKEIEYIIVDRGSNDDSLDIISKYKSSIAQVISEPDTGRYDAMNKGIKLATGKYVLFLNSGDTFYSPKSIELLINANVNDYDFIYGNINVLDKTPWIKKYPNTISCKYLNVDSLPHPATLIKRELFDTELYDTDYTIVADWVFFHHQITFHNKTYIHVNETISNFDRNGISSTHIEEVKAERLKALKQLPKYSKKKVYIAMTSWAGRINVVHKTIESLLKQTIVPECIYLTLATEEFPDHILPATVANLQSDKVKILWVEKNIKTMKKVLPVLTFLQPDDIIINSDDDVLFTEDFVERRLLDFIVYGMESAITSQPSYKQFGTYFTGCGSLMQVKMLEGANIFANDTVLQTYEDDWLYTFLCKLNGYQIKLATKYHIKNFRFFSQENSALRQKLYNTIKTNKVMHQRVQELFGISVEDFIKHNYKANWKSNNANMCTCRLLGRLGNQLFEIAAAKKYAKEHNKTFLGAWMYEEPKWLQDRDTPSPYIKKTVLQHVPFVEDNFIRNSSFTIYPPIGKEHQYLKEDFNIPDCKNICLSDFFQDVKYIDKDIAYELFKPYDSIINEIKEKYGDLSDYVSINVRRGDYLQPNLQQLGFKVWSKEDLDKIISTYFPNDKIIFTSDDIQWCKDNFKGSQYVFADKEMNSKIESDLYIPTQCGKGVVISNSTFSWWGAYLNDTPDLKVIVPYPWFDNNFLGGFNQIIPENWIKYHTNRKE